MRSRDAVVYARLPALHDLAFFRVGGAGMGNCFYAYFHAYGIALDGAHRMVAPAWRDIRIGPVLRRERTLRRYGRMFRRHPDEIHGLAKLWTLARRWRGRRTLHLRRGMPMVAAQHAGALTVIELEDYCFNDLVRHRDAIRSRLLEIMARPPRRVPAWGGGDYAAVHVRLGDFAAADEEGGASVNRRMPMRWYVGVVARLRTLYPDLPILLFSDGMEAELVDLLAISGVRLQREATDIDELLAMAQARLFVGSNSTFSFWATFLGGMPSIWPEIDMEPWGDAATPMLCIARDFDRIDHAALARG